MALPQQQFSLTKVITSAITRKRHDVDEFKPFSIKVRNYYVKPALLNRFKQHFGDPKVIPSFAFNATYPLIIQNLVQSPIQSKLLGLIHLSSEFETIRSHNWLLPCDVEVSIVEANDALVGIRYKIVTQIFQFKKLTSTNTNWMLDKSPLYKNKTKVTSLTNDWSEIDKRRVSLSDARKYARVSGDYNPIHMGHSLAKLFGLPRALIHGMFNVHTLLCKVSDNEELSDTIINVAFNKPCYLPNSISVRYKPKRTEFKTNTKTDHGNQKITSEYGVFSEDGNARFVHVCINQKPRAQKKEA